MKLKWTIGDWIAFQCEAWEVEKLFDDGTMQIFNGLLQVYVRQEAKDLYPLNLATRTVLLFFFQQRESLPEVYGLNWPEIDPYLCTEFDNICSNLHNGVVVHEVMERVRDFIKELCKATRACPFTGPTSVCGIKVWRH